ncbi:TonB-dependent siderophore receptor [Xylophilus sp. GW821-FHT01B05]
MHPFRSATSAPILAPARNRLRSRLALAAALAISASAVQAQPASNTPTDITISAQPLAQALNELARQARVTLVVAPALVAGKSAPALSGRLTLEQALERLLAGSGLQASVDGSTVVVRPAPASSHTSLAEVTVAANAERETPWGTLHGYIAKRGATATKTDTPLIETPQSISVITRDQMDAQGIQTVEQSLRYTAGVLTEITGYDLRYASLNIRGFDASLYRDGLRVFKTGTYGDWLADPQALERVEVLKGPSAVLYGQGGPGGLVNQVSKRPTATPINEVTVSAGNHDRYQAAFDIGRPLNDDGSLLFRLNGLVRDSKTQTDYSQDNRLFIAPALTWKPSARTTLTVLADVTRDRMTPKSWWPNQSLLNNYAQGKIPVHTFAGEPSFDHYNRDMTSIGYLLEHQFDDSLTLRQNLRYAHYTLDYQHVYATAVRNDNRSVNRASLISRSTSSTTTVDTHVQKDFSSGALRHKLLVGFDYQDFSGREDLGFGNAPTLDIFNPVYGTPFTAPVTARNTADVRQYGLYAQDQLRLGRWIVNGGLRHDRADTERSAGTAQVSARDGKTTGSTGLLYLFDSGLAPYASYATSFVPVVGTNYSITPQPETGKQFEVGIKYQPPGSDSFITASLFDLRKQNVTTLDPNSAVLRVQTGEVRSRGLELEAKTRLARSVDLIASYTWLDAWVSRSNDPRELGKRPFQTARNTAKLWIDYAFQNNALRGWGVGGGVRYTGPTVADTYNQYFNAGYTLFDAAVHYGAGPVRFSLNVANLGNKISTANRAQFYGQARTLTATLGYRW